VEAASKSQDLRRNRPSTCGPQKLRGKARHLVLWARRVLEWVDHLNQESRGNCYDCACTRQDYGHLNLQVGSHEDHDVGVVEWHLYREGAGEEPQDQSEPGGVDGCEDLERVAQQKGVHTGHFNSYEIDVVCRRKVFTHARSSFIR
jgi:hypothetical protein